MKRSVALLGLLLLGSAGVASAQNVSFDTVAKGAHGAFGAPANHVIRSQQELQAAGVDRLLPPGTQIDWDREMVIAALMGTQSTGGYGIEVTGIERKQMMTILPVPGPPPSYYLEVQVTKRTPPPGSIVTMALTSPFHVIKLAKRSERVDFVDAAPAAFDAVERNVSSIVRGERVRIERGGAVLIQRTQINALIAPIHGQATPQELAVLEATLRNEDVASLPARIPEPNPAPAGASQFRLLVEGGALANETRALAGFYGQYRDRIVRINGAIDQIVQRIENQSAPAAFDAVERNVSSIVRGERVRIERGGAVLIQRTQINALIAPIHGQATPQELAVLEATLQNEDVSSLPARIPAPNPAPAGASQFRLLVEGGALANETRALAGFYGQYRDRIVRINGAIDQIVQRIESQSTPRSFTSLTFDLTKQPGSRGASLTLDADGAAVVQRTLPNALIAPVSGQATAAELDAVDQAVRGARLASIPDQLPVPVHIMAADTFSVNVASDDPSLAGRTAGEPGYLQGHEARLRPLIDALSAIVDRIAPEAPQPTNDEAKGVVRIENGDVLLVESPGRRYLISNPEYAAIIRNFVGRTVKVSGVVAQIVPAVYPATIPVEVRDILYPERRAGESVQVQPAGSSVRVHVQGTRVRAFGPAASALRRAGGRNVELDGWLFTDLQGRPSELFVESVAAKAKIFSVLTRSGQFAGYLRRGQSADILRINGAYSLVRAGNRTGYVRTDRLEIGEVPVPLHTPSTPGLSGAVPGQ